jgi:predicted nucleic acid-binding protein
MPAILIDTNILLYLFDQRDPNRQEQAARLLQKLEENDWGRLSVQCLAEFFNVTTRRLSPTLPLAEAVQHVERWMRTFPILPLTGNIVLEAARGVRDHHLVYYDAQLWASARFNQIPFLFSEDFQDGRSLEGVRFVNPFASDFNLNEW